MYTQCSIYQSGENEKQIPFTIEDRYNPQINGHLSGEDIVVSKHSLKRSPYCIVNESFITVVYKWWFFESSSEIMFEIEIKTAYGKALHSKQVDSVPSNQFMFLNEILFQRMAWVDHWYETPFSRPPYTRDSI